MRNIWAVTILLVTPTVAMAGDEVTVTVWFDDGRVVTAELDARSDAHRLWLRFSEPLVTLASAAPWHKVVQGSYQNETYDPTAFRDLVLSLSGTAESSTQPKALPVPEVAAQPSDVAGRPSESTAQPSEVTAGRPSAEAYLRHIALTRVTSLTIDAELANWDADVEMDGLLVHVYPHTEQGAFIPVEGTLQVEVVGQRVAPQRQHRSFFELARKNCRVFKHHFAPVYGATYRVPFQGVHPEFQLDVATHGLVHVRLGIPGRGSFEASRSVRVRTFDPVRDQLELERGTRFLASERTQGAGP